MIPILALALVPIFMGLLVGYFAGIRGLVDNQNLKTLVYFVMTFALPCSLFLAIVKTPHRLLAGQAAFACCVAIVYGIIYALAYFSERRAGSSPPDSSVLALTLAFPNATAVGLPLFEALYGPQAVGAAAIGITIGAITITPVTLAILESGTPAGRAMTAAARVRNSIWRALRKPVFWSSALGIVAATCNVHLPPF